MAPHPKELRGSQRPRKAYSLKKIGREGWTPRPAESQLEAEPASAARAQGPLPGGKAESGRCAPSRDQRSQKSHADCWKSRAFPRVRRFKKDGGRGVRGGELSSAERLPGRGILSQSQGKRGGAVRGNRRPLTAVVALGLAPCCSKTLMMCVWPCWAAWCKGV